MKKYAWLSLATILFISFQNCAPVQKNGETDDSAGRKVSYEKTDIREFSSLDLWDSGCDEGCSSSQLESSQPKFLHVRLNDRLVETFPIDPREPHEKVCLSPASVEALSAILAGAEVCTPLIPEGYYDGLACTLAMQLPFAVLDRSQPYEISLGMKTSGCDVPTNLCGDKGTQLQDWTQSVISDYRADRLVPPNNSGFCE